MTKPHSDEDVETICEILEQIALDLQNKADFDTSEQPEVVQLHVESMRANHAEAARLMRRARDIVRASDISIGYPRHPGR